jgi:hypothetical protein
VTFAAQVIATKGYSPSEIRFGMRYADLFLFDAEGHPVADLAAVSRMERDVGAEPVLSGWEDRHWNEGGLRRRAGTTALREARSSPRHHRA